MNKEAKLQKLKNDLSKLKREVSSIKSKLNTNQSKIRSKKIQIRRLKSNISIHEKELLDLNNYRKKEENHKLQVETKAKKTEQDISEVTRQINREKIKR